ncbi:hypothetical protein DLJ49_07890 [Rhodovulum sp. 12E13]|uniref:hypothetical protein n=1 Tax=Rhodovulum sp. 12E13 TaxID=2203891 RepID=UPI000E1613B8|nr:hypothetical protein [Rhodovulum sp. 12E13]RDC73471.1 hypothetical protein DLJ49_07890 [Rhodovulum sp. 12E13]
MDVYFTGSFWRGWGPINDLVTLSARLFGGAAVPSAGRKQRVPKLRKALAGVWPHPRGGDRVDLCIARKPGEVTGLLATPAFRERRHARALWIIDSFYLEELRRPGVLKAFDVVAYTREADGPDYRRLAGDRAMHLPWGTDALDHGSAAPAREFDLLRVGRQPPEWDDDEILARACAEAGLSFHGRPPDTPPRGAGRVDTAHHALMHWYGRARFVAAFCNIAAPSGVTHPTRAYLTGRWTDALACGASVIGVPPAGESHLVDWPGALLKTDGIDRAGGIGRLVGAVAAWTPEQAARNHLEALKRLDWRWRLAALAERLSISAPELDADLARLRARIAELSAAAPLTRTGQTAGCGTAPTRRN